MAMIGVFVPVSVVFPDLQSEFETFVSLLRSLSRGDVLLWCARLNEVCGRSDLDHEMRQAFGIKQFFAEDEVRRLREFVEEKGGLSRVAVFFRGQLLELIRWALLYSGDLGGDGLTFCDPQARRRFAQAALIASDLWARRVYGDSLESRDSIATARLRSLGPFRKASEGSLAPMDLHQILGRGWCLFGRHMPASYPSFQYEFTSATGFTIDDYYICCCAFLTSFPHRDFSSSIFDADNIGKNTSAPDLIRRFVELESRNPDQLRSALWLNAERPLDPRVVEFAPFDYTAVREKPILRLADGRAVILDPVFFSEKASIGPFFYVLRAYPESAQRLFAAFGLAFEAYSCEILARAFPPLPHPLWSPLECHVQGFDVAKEQYEIDACLNYVDDLVLFEIKATWARERELSSDRFDSLLENLRRQYGVTEDTTKGVGQLARSISAVAERRWLGNSESFRRARVIYPVLVVHDHLLAAPGFSHFIAEEFRRALMPDDELHSGHLLKGPLHVVPPIVITVEELELLEVSVEHFGIVEILRDYSNSNPDRMESFHDYMATGPYSNRIFANRALAAHAIDLCNKAKNRLFANADWPA